MPVSRRGICRECGRELQVTAEGKVRSHGYARGAGDTTQQCPGGGQPPVETPVQLACFYCGGQPELKDQCKHCGGSGLTSLDDATDLDAVLVVEKAMEAQHVGAPPSLLAASAVQALMKYGFMADPEEAPNPKGTGPLADLNVKDVVAIAGPPLELHKALSDFYETWRRRAKGPQYPEVLAAAQAVEKIVEKMIDEVGDKATEMEGRTDARPTAD